ncbi:hypothetical protein I6F26_03360 [Ensifer sp. IC3342]|nr:hypothetical protein [Ensifer sp. BRP08]MCA1445632.1 hypothetical protein [Ensifer sp. IC3342]
MEEVLAAASRRLRFRVPGKSKYALQRAVSNFTGKRRISDATERRGLSGSTTHECGEAEGGWCPGRLLQNVQNYRSVVSVVGAQKVDDAAGVPRCAEKRERLRSQKESAAGKMATPRLDEIILSLQIARPAFMRLQMGGFNGAATGIHKFQHAAKISTETLASFTGAASASTSFPAFKQSIARGTVGGEPDRAGSPDKPTDQRLTYRRM